MIRDEQKGGKKECWLIQEVAKLVLIHLPKREEF